MLRCSQLFLFDGLCLFLKTPYFLIHIVQEQIRSGDASATELFELGAVMLRRKFYPAATKYLQQAISKWDGDDQDLAQVYCYGSYEIFIRYPWSYDTQTLLMQLACWISLDHFELINHLFR